MIKVENGLDFRNTFHLNPLSTGDIFVPWYLVPEVFLTFASGGRPESVNMNNVQALIDEQTKKPRFKGWSDREFK